MARPSRMLKLDGSNIWHWLGLRLPTHCAMQSQKDVPKVFWSSLSRFQPCYLKEIRQNGVLPFKGMNHHHTNTFCHVEVPLLSVETHVTSMLLLMIRSMAGQWLSVRSISSLLSQDVEHDLAKTMRNDATWLIPSTKEMEMQVLNNWRYFCNTSNT